jgi:hypothetical protein
MAEWPEQLGSEPFHDKIGTLLQFVRPGFDIEGEACVGLDPNRANVVMAKPVPHLRDDGSH